VKPVKNVSVDDDPDEVDISQSGNFTHTPGSRTPNPQDNPLAAAMLQMQQQQQGQEGGQEDPMMRMMQQLMGGMGGDPSNPNAQGDLPPMLKAMMGGAGAQQKEDSASASGTTYIWRIVHAIFAFGLAIYVCLTSTFNGSKLARSENVYTEESGYGLGPRLFIMFATAELLLQSTRYFAERGQLQGGGMFASIVNSGMIPEPYANYIRVAGRYITIARTIFIDVMVIVFVLGCMAWWNGMAAEA
jgi:hypothetical protein